MDNLDQIQQNYLNGIVNTNDYWSQLIRYGCDNIIEILLLSILDPNISEAAGGMNYVLNGLYYDFDIRYSDILKFLI